MDYTDAELIIGIKNQDSKILEYLYQKTYPVLKQVILRQGGNQEDLQDVMQDGILALFRNVQQDQYTKLPNTKLTSYFIQICKYRWYDMLKKASRKNVPLDNLDKPEIQENIQQQLEKVELHRKIHGMIESLGDRCKQILTMYYWDQKSLLQIAQVLDMEVASVKNGKYRCMQKLREQSDQILPNF